MARPRKTDRPVSLHIYLPESVKNELDLVLYSPLLGRVPAGAYSVFYETLTRQALDKLKENANVSIN